MLLNFKDRLTNTMQDNWL